MKNVILVIGLVIFAFVLEAQTKAIPVEYKGIKIYAMTTPVNGYTTLASTTSILSDTTFATLRARVDYLVQISPMKNYDAIVTRDGVNLQYVNLKDGEDKGVILETAGSVEVYFLSIPTKEFTVIATKPLGKFKTSATYPEIVKQLLGLKFKLEYNAIIVGLDEVKYVIYTN